ncbi:Sulfopropanediol 3-dehydrogenase [Enterobacter cloacae]|nr:Sulfopropanediol 3-dehydrogenase [Enterobacter cloacae]
MMILGPTESIVIADDSADPALAAADLLNEAEHGTDSATLLITASVALADAIDVEL